MGGDRFASVFDRNLRQGPVHESKKRLFDDEINVTFFAARYLNLIGQRRHDAVGDKYARESADHRRANQPAQ